MVQHPFRSTAATPRHLVRKLTAEHRDTDFSKPGPGTGGLDRYRRKGVLGKGVGNNRNASEMRQKYVKMRQDGSCFIGTRVRAGFRQNGFFADFYFWAARFFSRILSPDFFSSFLWEKSAQKNPPGKSPAKSSKIYTTKIPDTFLQRGPGQQEERSKMRRKSVKNASKVCETPLGENTFGDDTRLERRGASGRDAVVMQ